MKRRLFIISLLVIALCTLLAISASAASTTGNIDYDEKVTLADGTILPIYDTNRNPLIWYISGTEDVDDGNGGTVTKNIYSSVISTATKDNPDANGNYLSISGNTQTFTDGYGNKISFLYVTNFYVKNGDTSIAHGKTTFVVANLRGVDIGCIQGAIIEQMQYIYLPQSMVRSGDYRSTQCVVVDLTQCVNLRAILQMIGNNYPSKNTITEIRMPTIEPVYDEEGKLTNPLTIDAYAAQSCSKITGIKFPATTVSIGKNAFQNCTGLKGIDLPDEVTTIGNDAFYGCSGMTYFNVGANSKLKTIGNAAFSGCSKIEGVYLPDCFESFGTDTGSGRGSFNGCSKIWFKNSADETTKPDVYYFPSSLTGTIIGEQFKNCKVINSVLVLPSSVTGVAHNYAFNGTGSNTIVFMGDVNELSTNNWSTTKIIFANSADKSSADIATYTNSKTTIFCNADGNTTHMEHPRGVVTVGATCYSNEAVVKSCFCGYEISSTETEGTMLTTHNYVDDFDCTTCNYCENYGEGKCDKYLDAEATEHAEAHDVIFENGFTCAGVHNTYCSNSTCKALDAVENLNAMFTPEGYSYKKNGSAGISAQFAIDTHSLKTYEKYEGALHFGIIIANANHFAEVDAFIENGEITATNTAGDKSGLQVEMATREYERFNCFISGFDVSNAQHTALGLVIAGYVYGEDGKITYIQKQYETDNDDTTTETPYVSTLTKDGTLGVVAITAVQTFEPIASNEE